MLFLAAGVFRSNLRGKSGAEVEDGLFDGRVDGEILVKEVQDGDRGRGRTLIPWCHLRQRPGHPRKPLLKPAFTHKNIRVARLGRLDP